MNMNTNNYTNAGIGLDLINNGNGVIAGGSSGPSPNAPYLKISQNNTNGSTYLQPPIRNALRGRGPLHVSNDRKSSIGGESSTGGGSPFPKGGAIIGSSMLVNLNNS